MRRALASLLAPLALIVAGQAQGAPPDRFPGPLDAEVKAAKDNMFTDQGQVLAHVAKGEPLARRLPDPRQRALGMATLRWLGAEAHLRSNAPNDAAPLVAQGLQLIRGISEPIKLRGDLLMAQGALDQQRDRPVQALANYQEAHRIFGQAGEPRSQAIALQNIASLFQAANDGARAETYYRQAAEAFNGDLLLSLSLHNNRGNVLLSMERYAAAEGEFQQALSFARQLGKPLLEARVLVNLARNQVDLRRFDAADRTLARGFELVRGGNAELLQRHLLATSARLAADRGDLARAGDLIRRAFDGVDLGDTSVDFRNAHNYAHAIFSRLGEPEQALAHLEALKRLDDRTSKVATTTGAALMAARFNFAEQQGRIQQMKAEQAERTSQLLYATVGATLIVIVLLAWGLVTIRRSRNQVRDANVVLNDTNVALEKALKAKTEFLATTSHEIRTPLNGILGMTQVMLADARLAAEMRDRIGIVHGAGVTMRALVDDILDVAKMETGNLTVEAAPMDLLATLHDVTRMWDEQARAKGLQFRLELSHAPGWITSDAARLRQIVFNLLSNAIKFTARGGVTLRALEEGAGEARRLKLIVQDSGIGIPADKFEEIFESFRQVDAGTTRQFGGTGLGLTICRNLARALGGDIAVESVAGEGTRFIVDLPLVPAEAPVSALAAPAESGAMLVVDRNPIARSMLRTLFEPRVSALQFVGSAAEARMVLDAGSVDRLVLDEATLKVDGADPFEALAMLARAAGAADCSVLWGKPDEPTRKRLIAAGAHRVISKPIAGTALIEAIITGSERNSSSGPVSPLVSQAA